ncbi:CPBP family intramembrane glutamic endopeptidase [Oscillospiraceae bacterium LCP25S3_E10]
MINKHIETIRILIFIGITFLFTYLFEILLISPLTKFQSPYISTVLSVVMFFPALAVIITRLITKEGFKNSYIKANFKGNIKLYLIAWFLPMVLTVIGAVIYFLIFPTTFDLSMADMINSTKQLYNEMGMEDLSTDEMIHMQLVIQIVISIFSPAINAFVCFGEEWGWRAYLLPKMQAKLPLIPMLLINGVVWGLWHAPLTVMGHNYGLDYFGYPFLGILAMCLFCIFIGAILSYFTVCSKSVWPAALAHGSINGFSSVSLIFHKGSANPFIGPVPTGIIGGIAFVIAAVIVVCLWIHNTKKG